MTLLDTALETVRGISEERYPIEALAVLAPTLPEPMRSELQTQALAAARNIYDPHQRHQSLMRLAANLAAPLINTLLAAVLELPWYKRSQALVSLAPRLSEAARSEAVATALADLREERFEPYPSQVLIALIPYLSDCRQLAEASAIVEKFSDPVARAVLTLHLPEPGSRKAAAAAVRLVRSLKDRRETQREARWSLLPHMPEPFRRKALAGALTVALRIVTTNSRDAALALLAPHLPERLLVKALSAVRVFDEHSQVTVLTALAPHLSAALLAEAVTVALEVDFESYRSRGLAALAPHLPQPLLARGPVGRGAHGDDQERANLLEAYSPVLASSDARRGAGRHSTHYESGESVPRPRGPRPLPRPLLEEALAIARISSRTTSNV